MWTEYRKYILGGLALLIILFILRFFSEVVSYVLISWIISMAGDPVMKFLLSV
ncbi:MAG: hypothetical protein U0T81_17425 [Saprospiraceae bacterium]